MAASFSDTILKKKWPVKNDDTKIISKTMRNEKIDLVTDEIAAQEFTMAGEDWEVFDQDSFLDLLGTLRLRTIVIH